MADRPGGDPTEEPTPKRLRQAREKGQIARSGDFTGAMAFAAAFFAFSAGAAYLGHQLAAITRSGIWRAATLDGKLAAGRVLEEALSHVLALVAPILGAAAVTAFVVGYLQSGGLFTLKPLAPDLKKLNPLAGLKRLFSKRTAVEALKSMVKLAAVGVLVWVTVEPYLAQLPRLAGAPAALSVAFVGEITIKVGLRVAVAYAIIGAADYLWQKKSFRKEQMMTKEEVKREYKESEGDPQHKAERQRVHREMAQHQQIQAVRNADCVVVNPDHIAVALKFDENTMNAPTVVAKGERLIAQQIKEIARQAGVPIYRDVALARALHDLALDDEIPEELYEAVAEVLRFLSGQEETTP